MARFRKRQERSQRPQRGEQPQRARGKRAPIIELNDVTKVYPGGHMALDRVNLAIGRGEFVFLVGPTGCGKSTLIKMLIRELGTTEGSVKIAGRDIGQLPEKKIPQLRRNIGTVFQDFKLLPDRTRRCCWPTSPAATSTRSPRSGSCSCCTGSTRPGPRWWW